MTHGRVVGRGRDSDLLWDDAVFTLSTTLDQLEALEVESFVLILAARPSKISAREFI